MREELEVEFVLLAHAEANELCQVVRDEAQRFTFVAEALRFVRQRVRDLEPSALRLANRQLKCVV